MESGPLSNMSSLRKLCSPFSFWRSCCNGTSQDLAENSGSSPAWDYEKCKTEMKKKPQIGHIFDIMELDMLLLNLIKLNTDMLKTKSIQNQLNQLVELIKMNVNLLIHEPGRIPSISKLDLEEIDRLLDASRTTQASTQHDHDPLLKNMKDVYEKLEMTKASAGQVGFDKKLKFQEDCMKIKEIYDLLENVNANANAGQVEHQLAPPGTSIDPNRHIINFLPVELRPRLAKSNLLLVKWNLGMINEILILLKQRVRELDSNQMMLTDKLINVTQDLMKEISRVDRTDCGVSHLQDDSNEEEIMEEHAARFIELMCCPKAKLYIAMKDSFKDICNQVAAMYKHSQINQPSERRTYKNYTWCRSFHKDIFEGNWEGVEKFLKQNPFALTVKITVDGNTALHVAVKAMKEKIVRKLLEKLEQENRLIETLKKQNKEGKTAHYIAASSGFSNIAKALVEASKNILLIECDYETDYRLPLFVAAKYDHKDIVKSIYEEMKEYNEEKVEVFPTNDQNNQKAELWMKQWAIFLANLIYNDDYDMASRIMKDYPSLALYKYKNVESPLFVLAQRSSLGTNVTCGKASKFQCLTFTCGNKMDDATASKASKLLKTIIDTIDDLESQKPALEAAFFKAAEVGSVEFVAMFINYLPLVLSWSNDLYQNIFHVAIINRQENIFNLIYGFGSVKNDLTGSADKFNNWMLHLAGVIAPPNRLNELPGPAMQLQRELQWFKAVEKIVPKLSIDAKNLSVDGKTPPELFTNKTPSELFTSTHKVLMKDAQNWMRNTASQCSIVAALITTVMFAAAFTLPGGNNQNTGDPMFLGDISFLLFAVADLVAFSTSCTSLLIFLAILTSRFAQDDFLKTLPMRLFKGLFLLFVAMAAMIFAFCDTIYIVIHNQYHWFYIPIILVGLIPVFTFSCMMFRLLFDLWRATTISNFHKSPRTLVY